MGDFVQGRRLVSGTGLFASQIVSLGPDQSLWDVTAENDDAAAAMHGFGWLDDLVAAGDGRARLTACAWVRDWDRHFGGGRGPGWTPQLAGRRALRLAAHAQFLLRSQPQKESDRLTRMMSGHAHYLGRRARRADPGLPRFEALAGLVVAGLLLRGHRELAAPGVLALAEHCDEAIEADGGLASRKPSDMLEALLLLNACAETLEDGGFTVPPQVSAARSRLAPALRALRHADGGLARFHGGARTAEGDLDAALAASGVRERPEPERLPAGYARLAAGRTTLIADVSVPPRGAEAQASLLAFELTSGRRPVIVGAGPATGLGMAWHRAAREAASHSGLCLDDRSPGRLTPTGIVPPPSEVQARIIRGDDHLRLESAHDGYRADYGLTHARTLDLALDGRMVAGEDVITTLDERDRAVFEAALARSPFRGVPFDIRFHLHPDVVTEADTDGASVRLRLASGEVWVLSRDGSSGVTLDRSVYMEIGQLRPRPSRQVVLSGFAVAYATRVRWFLAKSQETPVALRDLVQAPFAAEMESEEVP
ncbi:heparinase II/III family protein [Histidinibacterium lentulum]|uniref:heparinase II/III family protein n=1 Tax=Histidinibacterium lentulum TaxID=2480588 RepID=UPI001FE82F24|nr:heparinase II/III family protein [Histidinibacterium lentulum]